MIDKRTLKEDPSNDAEQVSIAQRILEAVKQSMQGKEYVTVPIHKGFKQVEKSKYEKQRGNEDN